jgi:hypothetical protein
MQLETERSRALRKARQSSVKPAQHSTGLVIGTVQLARVVTDKIGDGLVWSHEASVKAAGFIVRPPPTKMRTRRSSIKGAPETVPLAMVISGRLFGAQRAVNSASAETARSIRDFAVMLGTSTVMVGDRLRSGKDTGPSDDTALDGLKQSVPMQHKNRRTLPAGMKLLRSFTAKGKDLCEQAIQDLHDSHLWHHARQQLPAAALNALVGLDLGVSAAAILFLSQSAAPTLMTTMISAAPIVGAIMASGCVLFVVRDRLSPKQYMVVAAGLYAAGAAGALLAGPSLGTLALARMVSGVGIGLAKVGGPQYMVETAPAHVRHKIFAMTQACDIGHA